MIIIIAGDFCPQHRVAGKFNNGDFESVLGDVRDITSEADYSIVNFECPVTYGEETPIKKCGPNLQCSENGLEAVKWAGFDCVTLANNHFLDYGSKGVENTLRICEKKGIESVGGGRNLREASKTLYRKIKGNTLAFINCCEHEFSIATETSAGSNPLNPIQQYYAIKEARSKADYVLVIVHGGHEMWQLPSPRMQETYRFFIDAGADAVVNHHQHCYSGYEVYKGKPIFYGLGNFCFDKGAGANPIWHEGYMAKIHFGMEISFDVIPYEQCRENATIRLLSQRHFIDRIEELNAIISDKTKLEENTIEYYNRSLKRTRLAFEPYWGKVLRKLYMMGWLPSLFAKKKLLKLRNMITCEAHRDKTLFLLNQ